MHKGPPSRDTFDAVVIGAGLGGLSCAAFLAQAGLSVLVAEKHSEPGGYATTFTRGPYRFECSLHMIDAAGPSQPTGLIFEALGIVEELQLQRLPILRREMWPDCTREVPADMDAYMNELYRTFPGETKGLQQLHQAAQTLSEEMAAFATTGTAIGASIARKYPSVQRYSPETLNKTLEGWFSDPKLRAIVAQMTGYYGLNSHKMSTLLYLLIWYRYHTFGGYYPRYGSSALSLALSKIIEDAGGSVALRCPVEQILYEKRRATGVVFKGGSSARARVIVSNASSQHTFQELLPTRASPPRYQKQLAKLVPSASAFKIWFVCDRPLQELGINVPEIWWNGAYDVQDNGIETPLSWVLVAESLVAPESAPPGKGILSVLWPVPSHVCERMHAMKRGAYLAYKQRLAGHMAKEIETHMVPGFRATIEHSEVATPRTFARYTGNPGGAIFGWCALPSQVGFRRPSLETPIPGLYQVGAWTRFGSGFSAVLLSGQVCSKLILDSWDKPAHARHTQQTQTNEIDRNRGKP